MARLDLIALTLVAAAILASRRRWRRGGARGDRLPAGLKLLAWHVGTLSTFGVGLPLPPRGGPRRRVAPLVGVR